MSDFCDPMDCSLPGSSVHEISQARILEWVDISFCRGSSQPGIEPASPALGGGFFTPEPPIKPLLCFRSSVLCPTFVGFFFFNYSLLSLLFLHLDFSFLEKKKDCTLWSTDGNLFLKRSQNSIGGKGWSSESLVQFNPRWQLICVFWFKVQWKNHYMGWPFVNVISKEGRRPS